LIAVFKNIREEFVNDTSELLGTSWHNMGLGAEIPLFRQEPSNLHLQNPSFKNLTQKESLQYKKYQTSGLQKET
jgi:hypothetical protein